jgi:hypothetical protein
VMRTHQGWIGASAPVIVRVCFSAVSTVMTSSLR